MRPSRDFDEAHALYSALMQVFVTHPDGERDPETVARIRGLCEAAAQAVDDAECRGAIGAVSHYGSLLYGEEACDAISFCTLRGAHALRFQALNALSAFRGRLTVLETRPRSVPELPALGTKEQQRVVVVEDNPDSAESLRKLLELCGYKVYIAYSAADGLRTIRETRPHVVLCDIGLPDTDGFTLAQEIQKDEEIAGVRLIAVTAYGRDQDRARSRECGFERHLVKPVDPGVLLEQLASSR